MPKRLIIKSLIFLALGLFFAVSETKAQTVYGVTEAQYDPSSQTLYGYSATYLDPVASFYYTAYVVGSIYSDTGVILDSGWDWEYVLAEVYTVASVTPGKTYRVISDHYVVATYYQSFGWGNSYYDPFGYSFESAGNFGGNFGFLGTGTATYVTYDFIYLGSTGVTFTIPGLPHIDQISPAAVRLGADAELNITGQNLGPDGTVQIGGQGVTVTSYVPFVNPTNNQIIANIHVADNATTGNHPVTIVVNGRTSNSVNLQVGDRTPVIVSINPSQGTAGTAVPVTIAGSGFGSTPTVSVTGGLSAVVTLASDTQISATFSIPSATPSGNYNVQITSHGTGSGFISVGGDSPTSNSVPFTVSASAPVITNMAPQTVTLGTDAELNITGQNLGPGGTVQIGGQGVIVTGYVPVVDPTNSQIVANIHVADNATTGNHAVTVVVSGQTSNSVNLQVGDRTPQITQINPTSGMRGSMTQVVISGSGFGNNPLVEVSGTGVTVTPGTASDTSISSTFNISSLAELTVRTVKVTSRGTTGNGFVTTPGNSNSATVNFTITTANVVINSVDRWLAPGVDRLDINYGFTPSDYAPPAAKLEIFKDGDSVNPIFRDPSIGTGSTGNRSDISYMQNGVKGWDGIANLGTDAGRLIGPEGSPYTIRISIDTSGTFGSNLIGIPAQSSTRTNQAQFVIEVSSITFNTVDNTVTPAVTNTLDPTKEFAIVKPYMPNTVINQLNTNIIATINITNKNGVGVPTLLPLTVDWSFTDPPDTSSNPIIHPQGAQGGDNVEVQDGGRRGPVGPGSVMWKSDPNFVATVNADGQTASSAVSTTQPNQGTTGVIFISSVIGGDNYKLNLVVKAANGQVVNLPVMGKKKKVIMSGHLELAKWSVRKALIFTRAYQMDKGVNLHDYLDTGRVRGAFEDDGYTDYQFAFDRQHPFPAANPSQPCVRGTNNCTSKVPAAPNFPVGAATPPDWLINILPPEPLLLPGGTVNPNAEMPDQGDTPAQSERKAQSWYNRNQAHIQAKPEMNAYVAALNAIHPESSIIGAKGYHPKYDGKPGDGLAKGLSPNYPSGTRITDVDGKRIDPNLDWGAVEGSTFSLGDIRFVFIFDFDLPSIISNPDARPAIVGRHEIGHASDHQKFGPKTVNLLDQTDHWFEGLMHINCDQKPADPKKTNGKYTAGNPNFAADSVLRLRGVKRR